MGCEKVCGTCANIREDRFRDKLYCVFDEPNYHQGRKTNEVKRYWKEACRLFEAKPLFEVSQNTPQSVDSDCGQTQ